MEIANEFSLGLPLERAWPLLTNLERIAPAMPGVSVDGYEGDELRATMRVKVGPIGVTYRAGVTVVSADPASNTVVLRASGQEARGSGTVEATITALLRPVEDDPERTTIDLLTDVAVTGRVAQFGGGVMREVADRLLRQFARRLEQQLVEQPELADLAAAPPAGAGAAPGAPPVGAAAPATPA
ncbi:SRPBCC family protein, partial [Conexibacter sp. CPCC 205762]|uniref:SRPBCC family protein n=2 Tax=Conexibacter TaxID=191494 RepID=UPI0027162BD9